MVKIKKRRVLLVGVDAKKVDMPEVDIETRGLGRPEILGARAADALYDYDVIVIHPKSYSHFIFGMEGEHSDSAKELWDLKRQDDKLDLDNVFSLRERASELQAALKGGARVVWIMVPDKRIHFFGWRSLYKGYVSSAAYDVAYSFDVLAKKSRKLSVQRGNPFRRYFEKLADHGWYGCTPARTPEAKVLANTPDGHALGLEISVDESRAWMLTAPSSESDVQALVADALDIAQRQVKLAEYDDLFLCHCTEDKPFVRKLRTSLESKGVKHVWVDEGELLVGDSLLGKIESAIELTRYFGVVLSPAAMQSRWVKRELEMAMNKESERDDVVVLPLLYKDCDLPRYLSARLYADFTSPSHYRESVRKLLRRLKAD